MTMMRLRPYQQEAVDATNGAWDAHPEQATLIALPTGTGKSLVVASLLKDALTRRGCRRALVLTHSAELVKQDYLAAKRFWPTIKAGLYCAQLGSKNKQAQATFASIQSYNRTKPFPNVDCIIIDEAHLVSSNDSTMYRKVLDAHRKANPGLLVVGLTATPYRMTSGLLTGPGGLFSTICYDRTKADAFVDMINKGYLVRPEPRQADVQYDTRQVRTQAGEFVVSDLEKKVDTANLNESVVSESIRLLEGRKCVLVFCTGVGHAEHIAEVYKKHGQAADVVHGGTKKYPLSKEERAKRIQAFKAGKTRFLANCQVLTTGFDHPAIDALVVLRPTQSPGLWAQIVGRGLRPVYAPDMPLNTTAERHAAIADGGKADCIVLDFGGNIARLGQINNPKIPKSKKDRAAPLVKECGNCKAQAKLTAKFCPVCGSEFVRKERGESKFNPRAAVADIISEADMQTLYQHPEKETRTILDMKGEAYERKDGKGKHKTLKVSYRLKGGKKVVEYVCLDHPKFGYPHERALEWWGHMGNGQPAPSVDNAFAIMEMGGLNAPVALIIQPRHNFPVKGYVWANGKMALNR